MNSLKALGSRGVRVVDLTQFEAGTVLDPDAANPSSRAAMLTPSP